LVLGGLSGHIFFTQKPKNNQAGRNETTKDARTNVITETFTKIWKGKIMQTKKNIELRIAAMLALMGLPIFAYAGTTGAEFLTFYNWINGIVTGYFGRAIAIASVAIGALLSVAKSNPIPILAGIAFAVFLSYTPTIINGILTATI